MFNKILVPTDGSPAALHAAELVASRLAPVTNAAVTVAVVVAPMNSGEPGFDVEFVEKQNQLMRLHAEQILMKTVEVFKKRDIAVTSRVLTGSPVSAEIAREARDNGYDLIVMSSRGAGKQMDTLRYLGSVTEHVVRRVEIPVLVIPPPED